MMLNKILIKLANDRPLVAIAYVTSRKLGHQASSDLSTVPMLIANVLATNFVTMQNFMQKEWLKTII